MWVLPQSTLMLMPSGVSLMMVKSAPMAVNSSLAVVLAAPLAQSTSTRMPSARAGAVEARYST